MSALFDKIQRALTNRMLVTGALAIHGSASALAKIANAVYYLVDGTLYTKGAADCAALSGTVVNATFNVFVFTVNAAGALHTYMGTAGASLSAVLMPTVPDGEVSMGFVIINPTGTGNFVGGTTALDDATVVPNAVYVNTGDVFNASLSTL
ncbi:MAG TPA: hypothetical protein VKB38_13220 [Terracidiphilus sp.]|nr:hypothetical protein [Terracidiphilus sp.]